MKVGALLGASGALVAVITACSGGSGSTSSNGGGCAGFAATFVNAIFDCGGTTADPTARQHYIDAETDACNRNLAAPGNGLTAELLNACANQLAATCDLESACGDTLEPAGTLAKGAPCGTETQCASKFCRIDDKSKTQCGACDDRIAVGQACDFSKGDECVDDAQCMPNSKGSPPYTCVATTKLKAGDVCYDPKGQAATSGQCGSGTTCDYDAVSAGNEAKCVALGDTGADCKSASTCKSPLGCIDGKCGAGRGAGSPCTSSRDCSTGNACGGDKKCGAVTFLAVGADCDQSALQYCSAGAKCVHPQAGGGGDSSKGKCVAPQPVGGACDPEATDKFCDELGTNCLNGVCTLIDPSTCK